jgi:hypothetical protein
VNMFGSMYIMGGSQLDDDILDMLIESTELSVRHVQLHGS